MAASRPAAFARGRPRASTRWLAACSSDSHRSSARRAHHSRRTAMNTNTNMAEIDLSECEQVNGGGWPLVVGIVIGVCLIADIEIKVEVGSWNASVNC